MKIATIKPDKYKDLSKRELEEQLARRDTKATQERFLSEMAEGRMLRLAASAGASALTGLLYEKKPSLQSIMGTPVSLDHLLALGGGLGAFMAKDDDTANGAEGIAQSGLVPLFQALGRKVGASLP